MTWVGIGAIFAAFPVAMLAGFGVLSFLNGSRFQWQEPSWDKNPFAFAHGEQLFHLGAFVMLATGVATLARGLEVPGGLPPAAFAPIAMGLGLWVGVRVLTVLYRRQARNGT